MRIDIQLNPRKIALFLTICAICLTLQSLFNEYLLENVLGPDVSPYAISFIDLFSVNAEKTIPTWFATMLLFCATIPLAFITLVKMRSEAAHRFYWLGLTLVFFYLSMDEGAMIHELFSDPMQERFNTSGYLTFGWLVIFVPLLLLFVLAYLRFLWRLPARTRNLFILAGALYVGGAVVVEAISANRWAAGNGVTFSYLAIATVEEFMEMIGVITFIYALTDYIVQQQYTAVISPPLQPEEMPAPRRFSLILKWILGTAVILIIALNITLYSWAVSTQPDEVVIDPQSLPFYQTVSEQYDGQGVVILGINQILDASNPAAPPYANSLLTLFDDVMVVTLPASGISIAFAGQPLPFDMATIEQILLESGETEYVLLDMVEVRTIAEDTIEP